MANFKAKAKKYVRKQAKRGLRVLKKRYVSNGNLKMGQIAKDVMKLKNMINSEVKRTGDKYIQSGVGQINGGGSGHSVQDISPSFITQGNDYNQRSGNSIKLKSAMITAQFIQQSGTNQNIRGSIELWMRKQSTTTTNLFGTELYETTAFVTGGTTGVIDLNSTRNPDYYNDYVKIRSKRFFVPGDALNPSINRVANVKMPISFAKHHGLHCRWNTSGVYTDRQFCLVIRVDSGNVSSATAGTFGRVPTNAVSTGLDYGIEYQWFYYDN